METCAAATLCSTPGACEARLTAPRYVCLSLIILLPIVWALLLIPRMACRVSGMSVVLAGLALGFVPTFFMQISSPYPCATAIGACHSISCACANFLPEGYVWMALLLVGGSMAFVKEAAALPNGLPPHLAAGGVAILFTGIYPQKFETFANGAWVGEQYEYANYLHDGGLGACTVLLVLVPLALVCRATHALGTSRSRRQRLRIVTPRAALVAALLVYFCMYKMLRGHTDVSDYCSPIGATGAPPAQAAAACVAWPALAPSDCADVAANPERYSQRGSSFPARYDCVWINHTLTDAQALLLPAPLVAARQGACTKGACGLFTNGRAMCLEFGMLFLFATYVAAYTLHDASWTSAGKRSVGLGPPDWPAPQGTSLWLDQRLDPLMASQWASPAAAASSAAGGAIVLEGRPRELSMQAGESIGY